MQGSDESLYCDSCDSPHPFRQVFVQAVPGAVALILSAALVVSVLHRLPTPPRRSAAEAPAADVLAVASARAIVSNPYGQLVDPRFFQEPAPALLSRSFSLDLDPEPVPPAPAGALPQTATASTAPYGTIPQVGNASTPIFGTVSQPESFPPPPKPAVAKPAESAPLPPPRPAEFGSLASLPPSRHPAEQKGRPAVAAAPPSDNRTFFQKLFGVAQASPPAAVSASAQSNFLTRPASVASGPSLRYDRLTAVYDVAAHTVYMPDGTRMEAHSGFGDRLDDPRYVNERDRGPTPPHIYELAPREASFHGVQALRLNPIGEGDLFGRAGLLAHPYMLGSNGASNGCVSFKDYDGFLQAYRNGQVKRLAVVASLN